MGLSSQAYFEAAKEARSPLEKRLEREKERNDKARLVAKRRTEAAEKRQAAKALREFKKTVTGLLKGLEVKLTFPSYHGHRVEFEFNGETWAVAYEEWTRGGNTADPDDYTTEHEGWKLHGPFDSWGHVLYEVDKYSTPPKLGPKSLKADVERCLRAYVNGQRSIYW